VPGGEVEDDEDGGAQVGRKLPRQGCQRFHPACGGADDDDVAPAIPDEATADRPSWALAGGRSIGSPADTGFYAVSTTQH